MAVPGWFSPVGNALVDAATGFSSALLDLPEEKLKRREHELKVEGLEGKREQERREAAAGGKPLETTWGLYTIDPVTGRYRLELPRPEQARKPYAKEVEMEMMLEWSTSGDPYKEKIAKAYLDKQAAAGRRVDIYSDVADARIAHLQKQEAYWQQQANEARRHNSAMEGIHRKKAEEVSGELGSLLRAKQWLESGTPEQQEAGRAFIDKYNRTGGAGSRTSTPPVDEAVERVEALQTRSTGLGKSLEAESQRLMGIARKLQEQGLPVAGYLLSEINKLDTQIRAAEVRAGRPPKTGGEGGGEVSVPHGPFGPTTKYRGAEARRYHEAVREGIEALAPLDEKAATDEVSRQPRGLKQDAFMEAWKSKFPGKVFRPNPTIVPYPEPRQPTSGRQGQRDRSKVLDQADTALDIASHRRFGKKYVELSEEEKVEVENATGRTTIKEPPPTTPLGPEPQPGTPEHRAHQTYKASMADASRDQALQAWEHVKASGNASAIAGFRRAYRDTFKEELR